MNLEDLARQAVVAFSLFTREWNRASNASENGMEFVPGFFRLYNAETGQSRHVVYHPESGYVFKSASWCEVSEDLSGKVIGSVVLEELTFTVRLPRFFYFEDLGVEAQEYVQGDHCGCDAGGWCEHAQEMVRATRCPDAHQGNWKITGDGSEIVLFDFDGIKI